MGSFPDVSQLANTLIGYHNVNGNYWRVAKNMKDVTVWRKPSEEFSGFLYKVQGIVKDIPTRIIDYIRPGPYRLNWDSLMTSMDIVKTFDEPGCCILRYTTAGQLWNIIAPREFVDFSYTTDYQNGLLSCGVSLEYPSGLQNFVRGFNHPCGWFCVPTEEAPTHGLLTGYIQTDLRGMLPQSAVDSAMASSLINFFVDLRRALTV
ncbi:stAR-related lipid transfer protein 4 [Brienomyrus brachyistius]|uniref:stAR-related lipid transfer protein 4 n=1 Tax=Brienomyrus brachyistius TaxID=42636 RepID=UPI0020B2D91B|nr:stAR-related lipid transfer protein 4 [Brienomyrus brachyistius]